jgi:hypothetical protein
MKCFNEENTDNTIIIMITTTEWFIYELSSHTKSHICTFYTTLYIVSTAQRQVFLTYTFVKGGTDTLSYRNSYSFHFRQSLIKFNDYEIVHM